MARLAVVPQEADLAEAQASAAQLQQAAQARLAAEPAQQVVALEQRAAALAAQWVDSVLMAAAVAAVGSRHWSCTDRTALPTCAAAAAKSLW